MYSISRRGVVASAMGAIVAGCAQTRPIVSAGIEAEQAYGFSGLKPLDLAPENLTRITVCARPFRPVGPRLEMAGATGKPILHNYGHGGSGWSLSWGYAEHARDLVMSYRPRSVAVLGAGAIGLTTATAIAETGVKVRVFAREFPMEAPSARATGVWSPSSRIALSTAVAPDFREYWAAMARRSYARHLRYVGRAGSPVEFTPRFYVRSQEREAPLVEAPAEGRDFLHLERTLRGLAPPWTARDDTPFPTTAGVRGGLVMTFNIAEYARQMVADLRAMGGEIVRADLGSMAELESLPGDVVVNCSGYGAKALVGDDTLVPVRGQIAWMAPQTDRLYGVYHRNVMVLSRRDGLLVQETGGNDHYGYDDDSEVPDRDEFMAALAKVAPIFDWDQTEPAEAKS